MVVSFCASIRHVLVTACFHLNFQTTFDGECYQNMIGINPMSRQILQLQQIISHNIILEPFLDKTDS